jgi:Raf kinase inhibitor-like YbhB/YbcL family protein
VSPALAWSGVPAGARELALIVDDPDASRSQPWVHWVLYKIPAGADGLDEGAGSPDGTGAPAGSLQGTNDFGSYGYGGPAPPRGHGTHHYHFKVYALDVPLDVAPGTDKAALLAAMEGHVLAQGELIGTYER